MSIVILNLIGVCLIAFVIWWFWLSKKHVPTINVKDIVEIQVKDGVYQPAQTHSIVGQKIILRFTRIDPTPCAEVVIFNQLNISKQLPLNEPTDIVITPKQTGEYEFTCQMGMYRGKLIIR